MTRHYEGNSIPRKDAQESEAHWEGAETYYKHAGAKRADNTLLGEEL